MPFQFSLHRQPAPGAKAEHHGFLADGCSDPRPEFLNRLRDYIGGKGTVVVYNAKFEKGVLDGLADAFAALTVNQNSHGCGLSRMVTEPLNHDLGCSAGAKPDLFSNLPWRR